MENLPKISIVIPSLNKVDYIGETLRSIFVQKHRNLEVIILDGGSTDGTLEIIKKYARKYPEVIYWESKKDKGQVDAINRGMKRAKGDLVAYINSDDIYENGALSSVAKAYNDNPGALWFAGRGNVIDKKGKEIAKAVSFYKRILLAINSYYILLITNYLFQPSVFLTKSAYDKFGPFVGTKSFVLEYDLWLKLAKASMPVVINKNIARFRLFGENISSRLYKQVLSHDQEAAKRFTKNPLILFLHSFHNLARIIAVRNLA